MENNISDYIKKFNIKLVMPSNEDGWKCNWKNCGWCCVSELTEYHNKNKCSNFDIKTKECRMYINRPDDCKVYPFMIITIDSGIILSPSLNCPYVLSSIKTPPLLIEDILLEEKDIEQIGSFSDKIRKLISLFNISYTSRDLNNIQEKNDLLRTLTSVKHLEDLKEYIINYYPFDIKESIRKFCAKAGAYTYIKHNYSADGIPNPIFMNIRVTTKDHVFFKNHLNTNIIKEIIIPDNILINDMARITLKQYIELNINRHLEFVSLYIHLSQHPQDNPQDAYMSTWISILYFLYTNLILVTLREKVDVIDYPMMREALSMTDSQVHGLIYTKPNIPNY